MNRPYLVGFLSHHITYSLALHFSVTEEGAGIQHSSFFSGGAVAAAGEIMIKDGRIAYAVDMSGHYAPAPKYMHQFLSQLRKQGVDYQFKSGDLYWSEKFIEKSKQERLEHVKSALLSSSSFSENFEQCILSVEMKGTPKGVKIQIEFKENYFNDKVKSHLPELKEVLTGSLCQECHKSTIIRMNGNSVLLLLSNPTLLD